MTAAQGDEDLVYSVKVLMGRRDSEVLAVYARALAELVHTRTGNTARSLVLGIALRDESAPAFRQIRQLIEQLLEQSASHVSVADTPDTADQPTTTTTTAEAALAVAPSSS